MKKFLIIMCAIALLITGCGQTQPAAAPQKISVKAMKVLQQPINVTYSFPGQVQGIDEVQIRSKINGAVVEKYIKGGDRVQIGQVPFKINVRPYETALLSAQADLDGYVAAVEAAQVSCRKDKENLDDTIVYVSMTRKTGKVSLNDVAVAGKHHARDNRNDCPRLCSIQHKRDGIS